MTAQAETSIVRYSSVELVAAVRAGTIRYPDPRRPSALEVARTLDGIRRGFPVRPLLLWQDPDEPVLWLVDGGEVVDSLLRAAGVTERRRDEEPLLLDTDTGEVVAWGQRPPRDHDYLDVMDLLGAEDAEAHLVEQRVVGERARRARSFLAALRRPSVAAQITDLPRSDLAPLFHRLPMRRGVALDLLDGATDSVRAPSSTSSAWSARSDDLVMFARMTLERSVPDAAVWSLLVVAEGGDPSLPYAPATDAGLPNGGRNALRAVRDAVFALRAWFGLGGEHLVPDLALVAVIARFVRVFPRIQIEDPVHPLLHRWVWRAALGESEIDLSPGALSVIRDDAVDSALRLLARTPPPPLVPPGREPVDAASRRGRMVLLGFAALHPRDLVTGELAQIERTRVQPILRDLPLEPANLLMHDHPYGAGVTTLLDAIVRTADPALLASHGIDEVGVRLLRDGDHEAFLARRAGVLDEAITAWWTRRIEADAVARRPVSLLFQDDSDG